MMSTSPYDDRMVVVGNFTTWNGAPCGFIMRLTTDGAVDPTFTPGTGADDRIWLNWKADGTGGWVFGYFRDYNGQPRGGITGLNADGSPNTSFSNIIALAGMPGMVCSLATQPDGKILIGGSFNGVGGKARGGFARLNPDGSLDPSLTSARWTARSKCRGPARRQDPAGWDFRPMPELSPAPVWSGCTRTAVLTRPLSRAGGK